MRKNKIIINYIQIIRSVITYSIVNSFSSTDMSDKLSDVELIKDVGECNIRTSFLKIKILNIIINNLNSSFS